MLPHPEHGPAQRLQALIRVPIACLVGLELPPPPLAVASGLNSVLGASVPEAAVDEDGKAPACEDDVGASPGQARDRVVDAEAAASAVQLASEEEFWRSPCTPLRREAPARALAGSDPFWLWLVHWGSR